MKNIFVFSNSYITRAAIYFIENLSESNEFDNIYVLNENHKLGDFDNIGDNRIVFAKNINECFGNCQICVILDDGNISVDKVEYLKLEASNRNIRVCYVDISKDITENNCKEYVKKVPTILIINFGMYTQQYCTELALYKIFSLNKVKATYSFSGFTNLLFHRLDFLKNKQITYYDNNEKSIDLSIVAIEKECLRNLNDDNELRIIIDKLKPEFVILSTNSSAKFTVDFFQQANYIFNRKIDCVVKSNYIPLEISDTKLLPMLNNEGINIKNESVKEFFAEDLELGEKLYNMLYEKIGLPIGVHIV